MKYRRPVGSYLRFANMVGVAFYLCIFIFSATVAAAQGRLTLEVGKSISLPETANIETVFVADTSIADVNVSSGNRVFVFGKSVGETTLIATSLIDNSERSYTVVVTHSLSEMRSTLSRRFPGEQISIQSSRGSILVTGRITNEEVRSTVISTIQGISPGTSVIDKLSVSGSNIIRLQVRLLEINRRRVKNFGINWDATVAENGFFLGSTDRGVLEFGKDSGSTTSLNASIDVLVSNNIATVAQDTVLSTVLGESAEFAVGGEIPVPNYISDNDGADNNNFHLDYQFIGTELTFTPRLVPGNKMQMLIESKVSSQTSVASQVNGNSFPNLSTRSFRTNVELKDRQPFVIAGLSSTNTNADLRRPYDTPFSRAVDFVFGNDTTSNNAQELVVVVIPFLGEEQGNDPVTNRVPDPVTNLEFLLSGGPQGGSKTPGLSITGPAGFKY